MPPLINRTSRCRILIVDDEAAICEFVKQTLDPHYEVTTSTTGKQACDILERNDYDVVVTDLRLPDLSGIDVLNFAKSKDEYTEVLIITGYASVESASIAVNLGASSYIEKPVSRAQLLIQVEKAVASRLFHLRSVSLMRGSAAMAPEFKDHLSDITALYYFTRKLTLSLEISELMRITLEEAVRKTGALLAAIVVNVLGFREVYAMSSSGEADAGEVKELFLRHWEAAFSSIEKDHFQDGAISLTLFKGKQGTPPAIASSRPASVPMTVTGAAIGSLAVFSDSKETKESEASGEHYFLYIISSIVASLIERGYAVRQARQLSKTDGLTGIANHRSFHEALDREIARANRHDGFFALIVFDIDDFKRINDTYGHLVGDAVLKDLTLRVSEKIRTADVFARYGGEEFGLILPQTDISGAGTLAQRIRSAIISKPFNYARHSIPYTVSIGLTIYHSSRPAKKDALIDRADTALYTAKRTGKNRISIDSAAI